jgi:hypothetical protein
MGKKEQRAPVGPSVRQRRRTDVDVPLNSRPKPAAPKRQKRRRRTYG